MEPFINELMFLGRIKLKDSFIITEKVKQFKNLVTITDKHLNQIFFTLPKSVKIQFTLSAVSQDRRLKILD